MGKIFSAKGSLFTAGTMCLKLAALMATVAYGANLTCSWSNESSSCLHRRRKGGFASDAVLLQRSSALTTEKQASGVVDDEVIFLEQPGSLVRDDDGFDGGDEIPEILDLTCEANNVRRRRRAESLCACRRRHSGKRSDGGWVCQRDKMVQEPPKYTKPLWSDEFNASSDGALDSGRWNLTHSGSGNGNNEEQFYTTRDANVYVANGVSRIVGKREAFDGKQYTSGKITTKNKAEWGPGIRVEVRAKLPLGAGTWPAIWMMPSVFSYGMWPASGEIDIMEALGRQQGKVFGTIHTDAYNHLKGTHKGKSFHTHFTEWHTYALNWEADKLSWYTDGNLYNTFRPDNVTDYRKWPFDRRFHLILNLALGGNLGGTIGFEEDQIMEIDYVRIFCLDGSTSCQDSRPQHAACCASCQGKNFCSPVSGNCYLHKNKDYYAECNA